MARPSSRGGVTIGVDIGGTNIRAARVGRDGRLTGHVKVRTDSVSDIPVLVQDLCAQLLNDEVEAVGIGIPGRLSRDGTTIISAGYVDLAGVRLGEIVEDALGRPVVLENDAHMALLAELQIGVATVADDVVMFTVGTGIGGAVAVRRTVLVGRGNAAQLGHLALDPLGPTCNCGRRGCSEVLASGTALNRLIAEIGLPADTTVEGLLSQSGEDSAAMAVLGRWAGAWRNAVDTVVAAFDPDLVVIGGGLGAAATAALQRSVPTTSPWFECPVLPAGLGDEAGVVGAGLRAFQG
jgi:glucokinase